MIDSAFVTWRITFELTSGVAEALGLLIERAARYEGDAGR
jgi:hypothetical protein